MHSPPGSPLSTLLILQICFLEEGEVREQPVLFDLAVPAAAAQQMIHSASHVYRTSEKVRTLGYPIHWQKRKEGFENSLLVTKELKVKKYAQLAVVGMQPADWKWNKESSTETKHFGLVRGGPDTIGWQ